LKKNGRCPLPLKHQSVSGVVIGIAVGATAIPAHAQTIYALSGGNLIRFEANAPGAVTTIGELDAFIVSLDFRAADGQLYGYAANLGVGSDALYRIDTTTAALTLITQSNPPLRTALMGVDFDPTNDQFRIVSEETENRWIDTPDPVDPATIIDENLTFAPGDTFTGRPLLMDIGYTPEGKLFGIDHLRNTLVRFEGPSSSGVVRTVGALGVNTDRFTSFDIAPGSNGPVGFAALGPSFNPSVANDLYTVDLTTGAATRIGTFGAPGVVGLAVAPAAVAAPEPASLPLLGLVLPLAGGLVRRRRKR
jgi:hypothetical protein